MDNSLTGRKPPDEIKVIDKLNDIKVLKSNILKIINNKKVNKIYRIKIFNDCFKVSDLLNDKKLVNDFFKLLSKISSNIIIEKRKYKPPIHCDDDLHNIKLSSKCFILSKIVKPVDVKPDIASK